jgi:uncharacterized cupin superfamily protein
LTMARAGRGDKTAKVLIPAVLMPAIKAENAKRDINDSDDPRWRYEALLYSDTETKDGALTQFGAFLEILPPGAQSSELHWHETEDEFVYVVSGEVMLVEGDQNGLTETVLRAGYAAGFKAGVPIGHMLINRADQPASYIVVGTRTTSDRWHYPLKDEHVTRDGPLRIVRDGAGNVLRQYSIPA